LSQFERQRPGVLRKKKKRKERERKERNFSRCLDSMGAMRGEKRIPGGKKLLGGKKPRKEKKNDENQYDHIRLENHKRTSF